MSARVRKGLISVLIVASLTAQVAQNTNIGYIADDYGRPYELRVAAWGANQLRWGLETFAFYTGINGYWRMFSPVHKYDWWWRIFATDMDGTVREIGSPSRTGRTGLEAFFVDFRETKLLLNIWQRPHMQAAYADHVCRAERNAGRPLRSVRLEMHWRNIRPPAEAAALGDHRDSTIYTRPMYDLVCGQPAP